MKNRKVVLIGAGNVGMSYVCSLLNQKTSVNEVAIIDLDENKAIGSIMDLNHGMAFAPSKIKIRLGDYRDCADASIVVICAGSNQEPGETRMDLIGKNYKVFKTVVSKVMENNFNGIFLVATNPVDIMTYITYKVSGLSSNKVIGSGTTLDTARLRYLIGDYVNINPKNIHAYMIGEHGDTEFALWSNASIGSKPIFDYVKDSNELNKIYESVKNAAYEIIERAGATKYGIGMCLTRITNAILNDENTILTVSTYLNNKDVYIGYPAIVNKDGIREIININLAENELIKLERSIKVVRTAITELKGAKND